MYANYGAFIQIVYVFIDLLTLFIVSVTIGLFVVC